MEDSESDWDSMSEPPVVKGGKPPLSSSSHPDRHSHLSIDQNQPPFDFSNEARVDKKVQEIQPKVAARKIKTYAVSGGKNEKVESRFSSPALKSLKSQQSLSLNPETIQKSKSASPSQQADSKVLKKSEKVSKRKILEPQETLDDIVNDPLDEDNLNDLSDEGIDNPAFYPEGSFEVEEKYDISDESRLNREKTEKHKIKPDESIQILPFSDIQTRYFQIHAEPPEVWADRILEPATQCCSWCLGEVFGILKIPFILLFVLVGHVVRFLIQAIVAPISNWILKPVIVNTHNYLWMPLCSGLQNLCSVFAQALHPLCLIIKCCPITKHEEQSENVRSLKVV